MGTGEASDGSQILLITFCVNETAKCWTRVLEPMEALVSGSFIFMGNGAPVHTSATHYTGVSEQENGS